MLFVIFLISGCATKTYTLNEGDIYIDSIEITNQKSCEEIERKVIKSITGWVSRVEKEVLGKAFFGQ